MKHTTERQTASTRGIANEIVRSILQPYQLGSHDFETSVTQIGWQIEITVSADKISDVASSLIVAGVLNYYSGDTITCSINRE